MELWNELLKSGVSICMYHFVCYAGQIGTKLSDFLGKCWFHIGMELLDNFLSFAVDYDHWKLYAIVESYVS